MHCNNFQFMETLLVSKYPITYNAIYSSIKHDYSPFSLVLSPTLGQLGRPLPEVPFFTLSNVTVFWKSHLTCFYVRYVFPNCLGVCFFLFWCGLTIILRLLASVTSNSVLSFQMSKILPRSFATPYA